VKLRRSASSQTWKQSRAVNRMLWPECSSSSMNGARQGTCGELSRSIQIFPDWRGGVGTAAGPNGAFRSCSLSRLGASPDMALSRIVISASNFQAFLRSSCDNDHHLTFYDLLRLLGKAKLGELEISGPTEALYFVAWKGSHRDRLIHKRGLNLRDILAESHLPRLK